MVSIEYLDEERIKLWEKIVSLEDAINKKTSDYENEAKQSSKKASEYRNRSENAKSIISQYLDDAKQNLDEIKGLFDSLNEYSKKVKEIHDISQSDSKDIKDYSTEIEAHKEMIQEHANTLEALFEKHDEFVAKIKALEDIFIKGDDFATKIDALYKSTYNRKKEIDQLYYEIMGYTEKDDAGVETEIAGLKDELEESYSDIKSKLEDFKNDFTEYKNLTTSNFDKFFEQKENDFKNNLSIWSSQYSDISKKIENLLPNALTAGLSHAYSKKKTDEEIDSKRLASKFNWSILGLVGVSLIPFAVSIESLYENVSMQDVILRMPRLVLSILPLYIPVMWLAYSSNKKLNLSKRLIEEYTHKEVLSKTFEGLSKQIANIDNPDISSDLKNRLLYNILEVSSENPGKLISDYNKSDHPLMDALDKSVKLANAVEKLTKIPGLSKLTSVLDKKSKEILRDKVEKAEAGLDDLVNEDKKDGE